MYYLDYLILTNSSPLLSPPLSEVVITGTFKVTDITNARRIISYKYFNWERIKFCYNMSRLDKTRLNLP